MALNHTKLCLLGFISFLVTFSITNILPQSLIMYEKQRQQCNGHFHLCRLRKMIQENKLYGTDILPKDINNFSNLTNFNTKFFKNLQGTDLQRMEYVRSYAMNEHQNKWLNNTLQYAVLSKNKSVLHCSLKLAGYFKYSFNVIGIKRRNPQWISLSVQERTPNKQITNRSLYNNIQLPTNIHGDVLTPQTKTVCEVTDYIRGTYNIECPVLENNFTIKIYASYLPPSHYRYKCKDVDEYLLKVFNYNAFNSLSTLKPVQCPYYLNTPQCSSCVRPKGVGFWVSRGGVWHWSTMTCYFSYSFDMQVRQCLKEKDIVMFGDSHMRFRHQALRKYNISRAKMIFNGLPSELLFNLQKVISRRNISSTTVFILNSGHWSLLFQDIATYMSGIVEVVNYLKTLKEKTDPPKIIWVEIQARPYNEYHLRWRTNSVIAALNDWVNHQMRNIGVDIVPAFQITLPVRSHTIDGSHYHELLEHDVIVNKHRVSGGGAMDAVLIHSICPS